MSRIYSLLVGVLIAFVGMPCLAASVPFSLTAPTKNTDQSDIPASGVGSLTSWRVEYGTCSGTAFGTKAGEVTGTPTLLSGTTPNLAPGTYCFRAYWKNTYGVESAPSNVPTATVPPPTPGPGTLTVQQPTAYEFKPSTNTMVRVGLVPVGTQCGPETKVIGTLTYCRLPFTQDEIYKHLINWPTNLKLTDAWAVGG